MKKYIILFCVVVLLVNCQNDNSVEPFNYERDTPAWLKAKIDSMSANNFYVASKVYRHTWHYNYVYYIRVGVSSCMYCELYYENGERLNFPDINTAEDYRNNRKDEILIWKWKD